MSIRRIEPRYVIVGATFLATLTAYVERVGFSIAFTAMAKEAHLEEAMKGTVLSAFYWGYGLSQVTLLDQLHATNFICKIPTKCSPMTCSIIEHMALQEHTRIYCIAE